MEMKSNLHGSTGKHRQIKGRPGPNGAAAAAVGWGNLLPIICPSLDFNISVRAFIVISETKVGGASKTVPVPKAQPSRVGCSGHSERGDADKPRILVGQIISVQSCRCALRT